MPKKKLKPTTTDRPATGFGQFGYRFSEGVLCDPDGHPVSVRTGAVVDGGDVVWDDECKRKDSR